MTTATEHDPGTGQPRIQVRLRHRHRGRHGAARPERRHHPPDLGQEERAGVHAGVAAQGVPPLADHGGAALWPNVNYPPIDYQDIIYYSAPKPKKQLNSLDEVDPELRSTFEKLGISLDEQKRLTGVAVDAVFDSVSVATTFKEKLAELGIIFCSFSEAVQNHPELVREVPRLGGAVQRQLLRGAELGGLQRRLVLLHPQGRALPDGAVHLLPHQRHGHRPVRADADRRRGGRYVSYLEGCTAPMRDENQLHAAVVELVARRRELADQVFDGAELVSRRQGRQGRHLQLRHQARRLPRPATRRFPGRRWRPARRSPGNTPAASCRATTRSASSTRWP